MLTPQSPIVRVRSCTFCTLSVPVSRENWRMSPVSFSSSPPVAPVRVFTSASVAPIFSMSTPSPAADDFRLRTLWPMASSASPEAPVPLMMALRPF